MSYEITYPGELLARMTDRARAEGHAAGVAEERARWRAAVRVQRVVYEAMGARYALDALRAILRTCDAGSGEAE